MASGPNGSPGINKMCRAISDRAQKVAGKAERDLDIDFGVIKEDYSLQTNTFPHPIPTADDHVCRTVGGLKFNGGFHGGHESGNGSHSHSLPELKPGDRVLVAWVQTEAVVIDVVTKL